jgi:hypothetical protein
MARSIDEIQQTLLDQITSDPVLSTTATNTSKVAFYRLWTRIVAVCGWTIEVLMDTFQGEVNEKIAQLKPHGLKWYATIAKKFQYGYTLPSDSDVYDNTGLTDDQIAASQIVKYSAVTEGTDKQLRIKVAKANTDLTPLTVGELSAFSEYMARVKDAGVGLNIESNTPDNLRLSLKIYYDPLILDSTGARIDGSDDTPVQTAVDTFLKNLPFNGTFVIAYLVQALQKVSGVVIPSVVSCETKYGSFPFTAVDVKYVPDAGYLRINPPTDLTITFIPQSQIS